MMHCIDSHVHIWTHSPEFPWAAEERDFPSQDAHPEDLIQVLKGHGVERAVLVQFIKYRWDNRYVSAVLKMHPDLFWGVCRVDPADPNAADHLSYWTEEHGFRGVRISPGAGMHEDWFTPQFAGPLFRRAAALKIPVVVLITPDRLDDLARILEQIPDVNVVIDHLADCLGQNEMHLNLLLQFARYPRVFLKLGHIAENSSEGYPYRDTHRPLEKIFRAFGAPRILWGSDWPFSLLHMTYAQSLAYVLEDVKFLNLEEREWVTSKTALQIWQE